MKTLIARARSHSALVSAIALGAALIIPAAANAEDWLNSIQDQRCTPEDIDGVSANVRNAIEGSVRRAEMSIQAPTPVGDLGCLNDLMTIPIDMFSGIGGLLADLQTGLGSFDPSALNIDIDVSGMICSYAAVKFAELTEPLSSLDKSISGYASLASSATSRLDGQSSSAFVALADSIWANDTSSSTQVSSGYAGVSGIISKTDSSGYAGGIANYVVPNTSASTSDVNDQVYESSDYAGTDESDAWAEYNQRLQQALGQYIGCRVARSLDGTRVTGGGFGSGTWRVPGSNATCTFSPGAWPASADGGFEAVTQSFATEAAAAITDEINRQGGQERVEAPVVAPDAPAEAGPKNEIWDMLGK